MQDVDKFIWLFETKCEVTETLFMKILTGIFHDAVYLGFFTHIWGGTSVDFSFILVQLHLVEFVLCRSNGLTSGVRQIVDPHEIAL